MAQDFRQLTDDRYARSAAAVVAGRQDDRVRERSRQRELRRCCAFSRGGSRCMDVATGATTVLPEPARAESQSAVVARRQVDRVRLRPHRARRTSSSTSSTRTSTTSSRTSSARSPRSRSTARRSAGRAAPTVSRSRTSRTASTRSGRSTIRACCDGRRIEIRRRRSSRALPLADSSARPVSVVALLDSFDIGLPDTTRFRDDSVSRALPAGLLGAAELGVYARMRSAARCSAARRSC